MKIINFDDTSFEEKEKRGGGGISVLQRIVYDVWSVLESR